MLGSAAMGGGAQLALDLGEGAIAQEQLVCEQVAQIFMERMPEGPTLGVKPLRLVRDDVPRAAINELPERYVVALTCLGSRRLNQLVYQLGHELLHVFLSPYLIHPLAEVLACAASLVVLDVMAERWAASGGGLRAYAAKFTEYRARVVDGAWAGLGIGRDSQAEVARWAASFEMGCADRGAQLVAASLIAPAMLRMESWTSLRLLHRAAQSIEEEQEEQQEQQGSGAGAERGWRASVDAAEWLGACRASPSCSIEEEGAVREMAQLLGLLQATT